MSERGLCVAVLSKKDVTEILEGLLGPGFEVEMMEPRPETRNTEVSLYVRSLDFEGRSPVITPWAEFVEKMKSGDLDGLFNVKTVPLKNQWLVDRRQALEEGRGSQ